MLHRHMMGSDHTAAGLRRTAAGTGNGAAQPLITYGRVPPQAAIPGSYTDAVIVTITY